MASLYSIALHTTYINVSVKSIELKKKSLFLLSVWYLYTNTTMALLLIISKHLFSPNIRDTYRNLPIVNKKHSVSITYVQHSASKNSFDKYGSEPL